MRRRAGKSELLALPYCAAVVGLRGVSQANLVKIAAATSWREFTTTLYTNIHNLSTGEIWFYLAEDYGTPWRTSLPALLQGGQRSILLASKFPHNASLQLTHLLAKPAGPQAVDRFLLLASS